MVQTILVVVVPPARQRSFSNRGRQANFGLGTDAEQGGQFGRLSRAGKRCGDGQPNVGRGGRRRRGCAVGAARDEAALSAEASWTERDPWSLAVDPFVCKGSARVLGSRDRDASSAPGAAVSKGVGGGMGPDAASASLTSRFTEKSPAW